MKHLHQKSNKGRLLIALSAILSLSACDRSEVAKLRAENEALKKQISSSAVAPSPSIDHEAKKAVLKCLRKLDATVKAGIDFPSYDSLVMENLAEIQSLQPEIPNGPFKFHAAASILAFKDARDFWSKFMNRHRSAEFTLEEKAQYKHYNLHWLANGEIEDPNGRYVNEPAFKTNLSLIWEDASRVLKLAEEAAKQ